MPRNLDRGCDVLKWVQRLEHFLGAPLNWVLRQHGLFITAPVVARVLEWG